MMRAIGLLALAALGGCAAAAHLDDRVVPQPRALRFGEIMPELGRRFELLGRAIRAERFELAGYEAQELVEVVEDDLPRARQPDDVRADIASWSAVLGGSDLPALVAAARARDSEALARAFASAAHTCNACHEEAGKGFIEVPARPGLAIPAMTAP